MTCHMTSTTAFGPDNDIVLHAMGNLGSVYLQQHQLEKAEALLTETRRLLASASLVIGRKEGARLGTSLFERGKGASLAPLPTLMTNGVESDCEVPSLARCCFF